LFAEGGKEQLTPTLQKSFLRQGLGCFLCQEMMWLFKVTYFLPNALFYLNDEVVKRPHLMSTRKANDDDGGGTFIQFAHCKVEFGRGLMEQRSICICRTLRLMSHGKIHCYVAV
jgi:hypothetical protein